MIKPFIADYLAGTTPLKHGGHLRVWRRRVILDVAPYHGWVYLRRIWSPSGGGYGTACLRWLVDLARRHRTVIMGHASRFSDIDVPRPSVAKLRAWYRRHGARFDHNGAFTIGEEWYDK